MEDVHIVPQQECKCEHLPLDLSCRRQIVHLFLYERCHALWVTDLCPVPLHTRVGAKPPASSMDIQRHSQQAFDTTLSECSGAPLQHIVSGAEFCEERPAMIRKADSNISGLPSRPRDAQRPPYASKTRLFPEPNDTDPIAKTPLTVIISPEIELEEIWCRRKPPERPHSAFLSKICPTGRS
ncbi:hypothetical protein IG631_12632 [Alternaria alternata]|nr:hypothetical protein IG631_12632 [Alternaria alternata]